MELNNENQAVSKEVEAFEDYVMGVINAGAQSIMISIGHKTGLFDVMAGLPAATSEYIADQAKLSERYVREWLAVMVTAGIVVYEPKNGSYQLPTSACGLLNQSVRDWKRRCIRAIYFDDGCY